MRKYQLTNLIEHILPKSSKYICSDGRSITTLLMKLNRNDKPSKGLLRVSQNSLLSLYTKSLINAHKISFDIYGVPLLDIKLARDGFILIDEDVEFLIIFYSNKNDIKLAYCYIHNENDIYVEYIIKFSLYELLDNYSSLLLMINSIFDYNQIQELEVNELLKMSDVIMKH